MRVKTLGCAEQVSRVERKAQRRQGAQRRDYLSPIRRVLHHVGIHFVIGDYRRAVKYLHDLADLTGGRFYSGHSMFGIGQAFTWIAEELGRQYSLGYYPSTRGKDGEANKLLTERVACVIGLSDRRFISVLDDCADVLRKISDLERQEERP